MYSLRIETAEVRGKRSWVHVRCTSSQFLSERAHIFGFRLFQISFVGVVCNQSKTKKSKIVKENDENEVDGDVKHANGRRRTAVQKKVYACQSRVSIPRPLIKLCKFETTYLS